MSIEICRSCNEVLIVGENWYQSYAKCNNRICNSCNTQNTRAWRDANPEKYRNNVTRYRRQNGVLSYKENKECASFLGVHIAEGVLKHVFNDVEQMPYGNTGFDFICSRGKKIDVKSSCIRHPPHSRGIWTFTINKNKIADYFLCLALDNREDLNPMYVWLIPSTMVNHLIETSISVTTIYKWGKHRLDINKVINCCDILKNG